MSTLGSTQTNYRVTEKGLRRPQTCWELSWVRTHRTKGESVWESQPTQGCVSTEGSNAGRGGEGSPSGEITFKIRRKLDGWWLVGVLAAFPSWSIPPLFFFYFLSRGLSLSLKLISWDSPPEDYTPGAHWPLPPKAGLKIHMCAYLRRSPGVPNHSAWVCTQQAFCPTSPVPGSPGNS